MNRWKQVLIITLVGICLGCQVRVKEAEQPQPSMEDEIRKVEAAALAEKATQVPPAPATAAAAEEKSPVTEAAPVVPANPTVEKLNKLLAEAAVYDYDKSRLALSEMSELIRSTSGEERKLVEKRLDEFLKSDATLAGKDFLCRELSVIGTEESISALAAMLTDANTADMTRYALERIPGEAADDAMINALGKTSGKTKVGIINSLGERRNSKVVPALAGLIYDSNSEAASSAAVAAIGKIGGLEAAKVLSEASKKTSGELRNLVLHAYLDCGEQFAAKGDKVVATLIFQRLYDSNEPMQVRIAALRGLVTSTGAQSVPILADALKKEGEIQRAAIVLVREVPMEEIHKAGAAALANLGPAGKVQMLTALADCNYTAALPEMEAAGKDADADVRVAALKGIGKIGNVSNVQLLAEAAANGTANERQAARESLYRLRGEDVDKTIAAAMEGAESKIKVELIQAVGERGIESAADSLLALLKDADPKVRTEALKALRVVGRPGQMPALIELLKNAQNETEIAGLEKIIAAVANKISDENLRATAVLAAMGTAPNSRVRCSFIHILGKTGGSRPLAEVRAALKDGDPNVQTVAIRVLSDWPSSEPIGSLLQVAQSSKDNTQRALALRGCIRLTGLDYQRPVQDTIMLYSHEMKLAASVDEKKMVLSGLSGMKSYEAIEMAGRYLGDSELQEEAAAAIVKVAARTKGEDNPEQTKAALKKVLETVKNEQLRKQTEDALSKIK